MSSTKRVLVGGLCVLGVAFVPSIGLAFFLRPPPAWFSRIFESLMMLSISSTLVLMVWMLVACIRDERLTPRERLRWELLLLVGGPITAAAFLLSRPPRSNR